MKEVIQIILFSLLAILPAFVIASCDAIRTPAPAETPHQLFNCTDGNGNMVACSGVHDNGTHNFGPGNEPTDAEKKAKVDGTYSPRPQ